MYSENGLQASSRPALFCSRCGGKVSSSMRGTPFEAGYSILLHSGAVIGDVPWNALRQRGPDMITTSPERRIIGVGETSLEVLPMRNIAALPSLMRVQSEWMRTDMCRYERYGDKRCGGRDFGTIHVPHKSVLQAP